MNPLWNEDTLGALIRRQAAARPDAPALLAGDARISWSEYAGRVARLAAGLRSIGVAPGDTVAVQLPNLPEFLVAYGAIVSLRAVMQTVHMPYRRAELAFLLRHSAASTFIGLSAFKGEAPAAQVVQLRGALAQLKNVIALGGPVDGAHGFAELAASAPLAQFPQARPDDPFLLLYTSGTTDNPKGTLHAHRGFLANARLSVPELEVTALDVLLSVAPLTHLYGLFVYHLSVHSGAAMSLLAAFTPPDLAQLIEAHRATAVFAGPAHFKPMLDAGLADGHDFASLRFVCLSGTAVAPQLAEAVERKLPNGKAIQLWGMSELQAGSYTRPRDAEIVRWSSAGAASPGTELRVVGDEGRLQARGASVFAGYLNNEPATREAFTWDGWFETGDTAKLMPGGELVLTGRVKEIINRGGVKYSPIDIEAIIDRMPGVARSAVVPMADHVLGERACVFVQAASGAPGVPPVKVTLQEIRKCLEREGVAKFKWPERLELLDALPLTPTQKVMRGRLRELLEEGT